MSQSKDIPVRVALRSRPLVPKEISEGCQECLRFIACNQQVVLGNNKAFTYDFVFSKDTEQEVVYNKAVKPLVDGIFKGYNATVLAYGQTGSGKTFSMGSGYSASQAPSDPSRGVIPRVITSLFDGVRQHEDMVYTLRVSYLEIHNEDIHDLLNPSTRKENIAIRESIEGGIHIAGLKEVAVQCADDMYRCLEQGSVGRTTASTAMNSTSSRSHAIFTIHIDQNPKDKSDGGWHAKFHLVDLAGSERVKKTHAEGDRFREGVNINRGLLALGNVISALGDENGRKGHVPYRNAKLTRLLQDSLGGNSQTLMIACVSPADSNMEETLNTLRYADRARRITNKPIVNRDPKEAEIARLRQQVQQLQVQLAQCSGGVLPSDVKSSSGGADMKVLLERNKSLEAENQKLTNELQSAIDQTTVLCEKVILAEMAKDKLKQQIEELRVQADISIDALNQSMDMESSDVKEQFKGQLDMLKNMQKKILEVQATERMNHTDLLSVQENDSNSSEENTLTEKSKEEISTTTDDQTFFKHHTLRQAEMGRELQELNKALSLKQELVAKMGQSDEKMAVMKMQYEQSSKQLENEVNQLMKEKEELLSALNAAKSNINSNKVSEQRRKRLQELEGQISDLKKKIVEQNKLLKFKEQSVKAVDKLNKEIHSMKQARVKLMRQMKEDAEKVRVWKAAKNKEVMQLKAQDRKRQCEYAKLERVHEKQQHVLRRKMEEAAAANKRLKDAMQKQKAAAESRGRFDERNQQGLGKRIRSFLEHELEVLVSINEAKRHLASLITDRKAIMKQLADLNGVPPNKKVKGSDGSLSEGDNSEKESLTQDLEMRNAQISDLQQKIVDADQDDKEKSRWKNINSLVEAKCALKWLMETAVVSKVANGVQIGEISDLQTSLDEATKTICNVKSQMEEVKSNHQQELTRVQQSHEEKILYLLKQLPQAADLNTSTGFTSSDQELLDRLHFQEKQISDLNGIHEKLQAIKSENDTLKKQLTLANYHGRKLNLMPAMTSPDATPSPAPKRVKKITKKTTAVRQVEHYSMEELHTLFSSDEDDSNSIDSDSDWHETPLVKRSRKITKKTSIAKDGCGCKGNCSTKMCGCVKNGRGCSKSCSCLKTKCINDRHSSKPNDSEDASQLNTTVVLDSTPETVPTPENTASSEEKTFSRPIFSKLDSNRNINKDSDVRKRPINPGNESVTNENSDPEISVSKKKRKLLSTSNNASTFFKPLVKF